MGLYLNTKESEKKRVLFTGGRAPVTLDLVRSFSEAGHIVYVADSINRHLARSSNNVKKSFTIRSPVGTYDQFIQDLQQIIREYKIDLLIPTCEEVFHIAKGKKDLEKECVIFCEDLSVLHQFHHKYDFIQVVKAKGLPVPQTYLVQTEAEYKTALGELKSDVVIKPVYSRFGTRVEFLKKSKSNVKERQFRPGMYVLQEEIKGKTICNYSILYEGKLMASANYKVNYTAGKGAAIQFQHITHQGIRAWLEKFFQNSKMTGQFAFDFIETETGEIYVIECNPRATSGVHLFQHLNISDSFLGLNKEILEPLPTTNRMIGLAMLFYGIRSESFVSFLRTCLKSKDIIWSIKDLKPFFYQFYTYFEIISLSRKLNISVMEASTVDIEWNGDES